MREECEAKVNLYVQELIKTNKEQAEQLKFIKENAKKESWWKLKRRFMKMIYNNIWFN